MAALVACAVGCAGPALGDGSAGFKEDFSYIEDGFRDSSCSGLFRIIFDREGFICPDPALVHIDEPRLRSCGRLLKPLFSDDRTYEPRAIVGSFAQQINEESRKAGATLIVLIHGIDNTYSEARRTFELARMRMEKLFPGRPLVFLEVYWDALCGNPLAVWGEARPGSKWVGLGLRPLLAGIDHEVPVRIVTHSRGCAVACAALWNLPLREGPEFDGAYADRQKEIPTPSHPDLRLAMIAAAMGEEEFESYGRTGLDRVILGINEDDPALNKSFVGPRFGGSTRLGCRLAAFHEGVAPLLNRERKVAVAVDLSGSRDHDFKDYLLRRAVKESFLPLLLEPSRPGPVASGE